MKTHSCKLARWVLLSILAVVLLLPAMSLGTAAADATVSDFQGLKQAISDLPAGGVIEITQGFRFDGTLVIGKSVTLKAADTADPVTFFLASGQAHFSISGNDTYLGFENVILDGNYSQGGIWVLGGGVTIENAVIQNCSQQAIYHREGDLKIIGDTIVRDNPNHSIASNASNNYKFEIIGAQITGNGRGISIGGCREARIENCYIANNQDDSHIGGIYTSCPTTVTNSEIIGNSAQYGGGIGSTASLVVENCTISNNSAITNGGGISANGNTTIRNSVIAGNQSEANGGGIFTNKTLLVEQSTISDNTSATLGGGIYGGNVTLLDSVITGNRAQNGGGTHNNFQSIKVRGESIIADNIADVAYHMTDPAHIAIHEQNIDPTVTWTEGFEYAFNNLDIGYTRGTPVDPPNMHTVTLTEQWADGSQPENTTTYRAVRGRPLTIDFATPHGYVAEARVPDGVLVDCDAGTITIPEVTGDLELLLVYTPENEVETHTVTVIGRYLDGGHPDDTKVYRVPHGAQFFECYEMHPGYAYDEGGLFLDSLEWIINAEEQTLYINSVERDYVFELDFKRVAYNVTVIVRYENSDLAYSVDVYTAAVGSSFEQAFPFPDGFEFIGFASDTVGVSVNATNRLVKVRNVADNVTVTITLRAE